MFPNISGGFFYSAVVLVNDGIPLLKKEKVDVRRRKSSDGVPTIYSFSLSFLWGEGRTVATRGGSGDMPRTVRVTTQFYIYSAHVIIKGEK